MKHTGMGNKLLAAVLTLCMALQLLPVAALATGATFQGAESATLKPGESLDLLSGVTAVDAEGNALDVSVYGVTSADWTWDKSTTLTASEAGGESYVVTYVAKDGEGKELGSKARTVKVEKAAEPESAPEGEPASEPESEPEKVFVAAWLNLDKEDKENDIQKVPDFYAPANLNKYDKASLFTFKTGGDGDDLYRVYGAWDGGEPGFYRCDKNGKSVADKPVTESADRKLYETKPLLAAETPIVESPVCNCDPVPAEGDPHAGTCPCYVAPAPVCNCDPAPAEGDPHAETCPCYVAPAPVCNCDPAPAEGEAHAETCPCYVIETPVAESPVCNCDPAPAEGEPHVETCPCYIAPTPVCICGAAEGAAHDETCPCYVPVCSCGAEEGEAHLPDCPCYIAPAAEGGAAGFVSAVNALDSEAILAAATAYAEVAAALTGFVGAPTAEQIATMDAFDAAMLPLTEAIAAYNALSAQEKEYDAVKAAYATAGALYNEVARITGMDLGTLGGSHPTLDGDYMYLSEFNITSILDGTGPFDTNTDMNAADYSERPGNDAANNNKKVRSFDSISYDISYRTASSGEYDYIVNGYLYYELRLPKSANELSFDTGNMGWMGDKVNDLSAVAAGANGYTLTTTATSTVIYGKRFLQPSEGNPYAMPGSGTLNVIVNVGTMTNGELVQPTFKAWMENNVTTGTCATHNRDEVKVITPDPVTVTAQLRMNVQLKQTTNIQASQTWDFAGTGNANALDKSAGSAVSGRLTVYGVTLQLYNDNANRGLKGCEIPSGPITFDLDLSSTFKPTGGTEVDATTNYAPLVWNYDGNNYSNVSTADGRAQNMSNYTYACLAAPYNSGGPAVNTAAGTNSCYSGGAWAAAKSGNKVAFTVSGYTVNPNSFPNANAGNAGTTSIYYDPAAGVQSIGCFSAGELWVVQPFENSTTGASVLDDTAMNPSGAASGDFYLTVQDSNLRASSANGGSLAQVTDTSNQSVNGTDDSLRSQVYLVKPGTFYGAIIWSRTETSYGAYDTNGLFYSAPGSCFYNGLDQVTLGQGIGINWYLQNQTSGDAINRMLAGNYLMKFDAAAVTLGAIKTPNFAASSIPKDNGHRPQAAPSLLPAAR